MRPYLLFAYHCNNNASPMGGLPVFEQKNALPRSQMHSRVHDRDYFTRSCQHHPDVRGHVVRSFVVVLEVGRVFGHEPIEEFFEIAPRSRICVLHDDEAAAGVLNENRQCASSDAAPGQDLRNLICNFIGPFASGVDGDQLGVDGQGRHLVCMLVPAIRCAIGGM